MKEYLEKHGDNWSVIPGTVLYKAALETFHDMWGTMRDGVPPPFFPGPQPVSIERKHFPVLKNNPYVVCEKTDGTRVALLAFTFQSKKVTLLLNRALLMTYVTLNLPRQAHQGTILDGELVDKSLMVYDAVWVSGENLKPKNFLDRLDVTGKFIKSIMRLAKDPVVVKLKNFVVLSELRDFQLNVVPKLPYKTDGLVFTPVNDPIRVGTHETMFKWKPRDQNTIDFQVKWNGQRCGLFIQERGKLFFESEIPSNKIDDSFANWLVDDTIVECQYMVDEYPMWWKPIGVRTDKTYPNNRRTFFRTIVNVKENIQWQEFC